MAKNLADSIQMEVRSPQPCCKELDFVVPVDAIASETGKVLLEFVGAISIPGFRQGKAPAVLIRKKYSEEIRQELERRSISAAFELVRQDESLEIVDCDLRGTPKLEFDQEFKFTLEADIAPEIELPDYKAIKVQVELDAVTEEQIDERIQHYRSLGPFADVTDPARKNDLLKVSYQSDFQLPENPSAALKRQISAENAFLWLEEPELIPGCVAALTGAEIGREYPLKAEYPANYPESALAGKTVEYTVKVEGIQRRTELSDEKLLDTMRAKSLPECREMIRKALERANAERQHEAIIEKIYAELDQATPEFDLPPRLFAETVQQDLNRMRRSQENQAEAEKFQADLPEHTKQSQEAAKKMLRRIFILRRIAQLENIKVEESQVDSQLREMSRYYGYSEKDFRSILRGSGKMDSLLTNMLCDKVLEQLAEGMAK